jgi:hypothetical protein
LAFFGDIRSVAAYVGTRPEPAHSSGAGIEMLCCLEDLVDCVVRHRNGIGGGMKGRAKRLLLDHGHWKASLPTLLSSTINA